MKGITYILIAVCTYWVLKLCFGSRKGTVTDVPNNHFAYIAIGVFFTLFIGVPYWGNKIPGSAFERRNYIGKYYAIMYEGNQRDVPIEAQVTIEADVVDVSGGYDDGTDTPSSRRVYYLKRLFDKFGRSISFEEEDEQKELELNKIVRVYKTYQRDSIQKEWGIMLLNIPVNSSSPIED